MMVPVAGRAPFRFLAALIAVALLVGTQAAPGAAASYDARKIEPALLAEVLANPKADFDVIVTGAPAPGAGKKDAKPSKKGDATERVGKALGKGDAQKKRPLGIVSGATATLKGEKVLKLSLDRDVELVVGDSALEAHAFTAEALGASAALLGGAAPALGAGNDGFTLSQTALAKLRAPEAWAKFGVKGAGVGVAVIDSGVYAHPDLAGRIVAAIDLTSPSPTLSRTPLGDPGGHGTAVAGLIAGNGAASGGSVMGVAPAASIIDVRVLDAAGSSKLSTVLAGMQWVLGNRAAFNIRVANVSFGGTPRSSYTADVLASATEMLTLAGVAVVVSAGNNGPGAQTISSPATDPFVMSAAAVNVTGTSTNTTARVSFSAVGPTPFDLLAKPDIAAPGVKLAGLLAPGSTLAEAVGTGKRLNGVGQPAVSGASDPVYLTLSGTSMAAPLVAGAAALLVAKDPTLTPNQVKERLTRTAADAGSKTRGSSFVGSGVLDVYASLQSSYRGARYARARIGNLVARTMADSLAGQPLTWLSGAFHGGVDSQGISWENISWDNITWDNITWDNISWDNISWDNISWDNISWDNISWDNISWETTTSPVTPAAKSAWKLVKDEPDGLVSGEAAGK